MKIAIVYDGKAWHVRRIRVIEHDVTRDEKVYRCDLPIANDYATANEAIDAAIRALGGQPRAST